MWTLDELLDRVSAALTAEYSGAPNGRVRDVPDKRAVRWYATTGLVDRPSAMRGRSALYERRHLLQLVAVKRLQSQGRTLADIQAELTGATDTTLAAIARVPEHLLVDSGDAPPPEEVRPRFWAAPAAPPTGASAGAPILPPAGAASPPAGALPAAAGAAPTAPPALSGTSPASPAAPPAAPTPPAPPEAFALNGVALPGGAVLLIPGTPTAADRAEIAAAARPLLDLLQTRGLLNEREPS
ncbi:MerR family transcriptional regulator [Lentzea sp. NPDC058436]|uniref:MerR family transcriptional regulator n=1 Tax=Lentzea sp. NPDC058436 TaxID=3346499 RepID=UPI003661C6FD